MKQFNKKGFTIVELIIVIAIVAVLASILIPTFANVINKANDSAYQQERTNQMIQDAVEKIDQGKGYMSWEDLEEAIAEALKDQNSGDLADKIIAIIKDKDSTGLTNEQLTKILEAIANKKFSENQVKVIIDTEDLKSEGLTDADIEKIIAKLPQVGITQEDIEKAVQEVVNDQDLAAKIKAAVAAAVEKIPTLDEDDITRIIEEVLAVNLEKNGEYVARIGAVGYNTFAAAYAGAENGDTIVLLQNIVLGETIEGNFVQEEWTTSFDFDKAGITLDLNGKTLISTSVDEYLIGFYIKQGAELTIKDTVGGGKILAPNAAAVISCYGVINIYGGTIQSQYTSGLSDALRVNGRANIYGGAISSATNYYYPNFGYFGNNGLNNCGVTYIYGGTFSCQVKDEPYNGAIANSGSLYIMDNIITQGLYWTNDNGGVTETIISVAEGKTLTVEGAYALNPLKTIPIVLNGNAIYTDEDGNIAIIYTEYTELDD